MRQEHDLENNHCMRLSAEIESRFPDDWSFALNSSWPRGIASFMFIEAIIEELNHDSEIALGLDVESNLLRSVAVIMEPLM